MVVDHREVQSSRQHPASACVLGEAARVAPLEDAGCPLWAYRLELTDETLAQWSADHHDEVLLVLSGALRDQAGQWSCGPGDAYVIEAGVPAQVVLEAGTDLVHFGSRGGEPWGVLGPPVGAGSCYPLPATGRATHDTPLGGVVVTTSFWADSTRASSRLALLEVAGTGGHASPPHAHSADEIIFVVEGELTIGRDVVRAGMSAFIPADRRYRFTSDTHYRFVNFRRDASTITLQPGSEPLLETAAGLTGTAAL